MENPDDHNAPEDGEARADDGDENASAGDALSARDGDVLVVSYPEVKIPIGKFASTTVGGLIYTRRLLDGDDVQAEHDRIYAFLKRNAEREAREKVKLWVEELRAGSPRTPAAPSVPRPAPIQRGPARATPATVAQPATQPAPATSATPPPAPGAASSSNPKPKPVPPRPR